MTTASPAPGSQGIPVACSWCDAVAVAVYVQRHTGEAFAFCADCDPVSPATHEPDACAEHPAGCPERAA
jgi:hypothetical protein